MGYLGNTFPSGLDYQTSMLFLGSEDFECTSEFTIWENKMGKEGTIYSFDSNGTVKYTETNIKYGTVKYGIGAVKIGTVKYGRKQTSNKDKK